MKKNLYKLLALLAFLLFPLSFILFSILSLRNLYKAFQDRHNSTRYSFMSQAGLQNLHVLLDAIGTMVASLTILVLISLAIFFPHSIAALLIFTQSPIIELNILLKIITFTAVGLAVKLPFTFASYLYTYYAVAKSTRVSKSKNPISLPKYIFKAFLSVFLGTQLLGLVFSDDKSKKKDHQKGVALELYDNKRAIKPKNKPPQENRPLLTDNTTSSTTSLNPAESRFSESTSVSNTRPNTEDSTTENSLTLPDERPSIEDAPEITSRSALETDTSNLIIDDKTSAIESKDTKDTEVKETPTENKSERKPEFKQAKPTTSKPGIDGKLNIWGSIEKGTKKEAKQQKSEQRRSMVISEQLQKTLEGISDPKQPLGGIEEAKKLAGLLKEDDTLTSPIVNALEQRATHIHEESIPHTEFKATLYFWKSKESNSFEELTTYIRNLQIFSGKKDFGESIISQASQNSGIQFQEGKKSG